MSRRKAVDGALFGHLDDFGPRPAACDLKLEDGLVSATGRSAVTANRNLGKVSCMWENAAEQIYLSAEEESRSGTSSTSLIDIIRRHITSVIAAEDPAFAFLHASHPDHDAFKNWFSSRGVIL